MEWKKIAEEKPENDGCDIKVLTYGKYGCQILTYNAYYDCWDDEDGDDTCCPLIENDDFVTHWMELPEPPK